MSSFIHFVQHVRNFFAFNYKKWVVFYELPLNFFKKNLWCIGADFFNVTLNLVGGTKLS